MTEEEAHLREPVQQCFQELSELLTQLSDSHPTLVVLAALAEQLGIGLQGSCESGACSPAQVREILDRMKAMTFATKVDPPAGKPP